MSQYTTAQKVIPVDAQDQNMLRNVKEYGGRMTPILDLK